VCGIEHLFEGVYPLGRTLSFSLLEPLLTGLPPHCVPSLLSPTESIYKGTHSYWC
jgi:hypothetical protein